MSREPFETMPDVMDAKQIAQALAKPSSENPATVNPMTDKPIPENPTQINTKEVITKKQNTN